MRLNNFVPDISEARKQLQTFGEFLTNHPTFKEQTVLAKLDAWKHLFGFAPNSLNACDCLKFEFELGNFRADAVIGDSVEHRFCFIEFEDALKTSIFTKSKRSYDTWSKRFEGGFSQLIDWFEHLNYMEHNPLLKDTFGSQTIEIEGILVIGRDAFLDDQNRCRLRWRQNHVLIDSHKIACLTFDQFYRKIDRRINRYGGKI